MQPAQLRFKLLDALRGFAIFGIFGVNMLAGSLYFAGNPDEFMFSAGKADAVFTSFLDVLIEGKFYSIFSLLFGIGFGLQMQALESKGVNGLLFFKRRLWGMLLIGLLHMLLLWLGDIVFLYAWLGFVLIVFRKKSDRFLLRAAVFCLLLPVLLFPLRLIDSNMTLATPFYMAMMGIGSLMGIDFMSLNPAEMMAAPGWGSYFRSNLLGFFYRQADLIDQVRPLKVFAMLLIGLWVSRKKWYQDPQIFIDRFKKWIPVVLPVALLINVGMALLSWDTYYSGQWLGWLKTLFYSLGVVPLSLCYVYLFTKVYIAKPSGFLHPFTYVGRMALSNYIFQSIVYVIIFRGVGLGLAGKVAPLACMVPVLVIFPLQVVASRWWLQQFRFGPLEWLWRSITYGSWQPMKRNKVIEPPVVAA